jgi:hypothetical protein
MPVMLGLGVVGGWAVGWCVGEGFVFGDVEVGFLGGCLGVGGVWGGV